MYFYFNSFILLCVTNEKLTTKFQNTTYYVHILRIFIISKNNIFLAYLYKTYFIYVKNKMHITRLQNGRSTEDYYKNPTLFPFRQLLTDFGINEETATIMFADKGVFYIVLYIELL